LAVLTRREKKRPPLRVRVFDLNGVLVADPEPAPTTDGLTLAWRLELAGLAAGVHRVDVTTEDEVVWRAYYRLSE
jgi:hypothetical protein